MRRLPSLNGLRAFEAAARLGGFAAAAEELHVTPTAVSRLVRLLEQRLGVALFERQPNKLSLTPQGAQYLPGLTAAFDEIARLTARVTAGETPPALTVAAGPTFLMRWLIPRLPRFQSAHSDIAVRLATATGAAQLFAPDWSAAIRMGDGNWPGFVSTFLLTADLFPVCVPAIARRLKRPADLAGETLLRVTTAPEDWPLWLKRARAGEVKADGPAFDYDAFALQAALDGLGVALGRRPYVADDLAAGRLVAPFRTSVPKGKGWYLIHPPLFAGQAPLARFRAWLLEETKA